MMYKDLVSVSLRSYIHSYKIVRNLQNVHNRSKFPSPYGVIFILIFNVLNTYIKTLNKVSVSLRSYIHSYIERLLKFTKYGIKSFRLLTELYSFLL